MITDITINNLIAGTEYVIYIYLIDWGNNSMKIPTKYEYKTLPNDISAIVRLTFE